MVVETSSGNRYCYDIKSNRIDVYNEGDVSPVTSPIVFGEVEKVESFPNIDTFILELTQNCNFRCSYCCYGGNYEGNRTHSPTVMSEETLNKSISFIAKHRIFERRLNIVFYGGEPTLYPDKIKYFVKQVKGILPQDADYTISTNGSRLLDDNFLGWCVEHDFTLNISYDGTPQSELKRINKNGCDTQQDVLNVLEQIKTEYPEYWDSKVNILVTLPDIHNLKQIAIEWSRSWVLRSKAPYLISGVSPCKLSDYVIDEEGIIVVMRDLKDFYAHNHDNLFVKTYFDLLCTPILDRPIFPLPDNHSPLMCLPLNNRCNIDAYGNLGICEKTSDKLRLGNVYEGWDFNKVNEAITKMATLRKKRCGHCDIFRFCRTCFSNYYFNDEWWKADCDWQRRWTRIAMTISLELLEQALIATDDANECNLREIQRTDIPDIYRIMSDPATMKYLDGVETFKNSEDSLRFYLLMSEINDFRLPSEAEWEYVAKGGHDNPLSRELAIIFEDDSLSVEEKKRLAYEIVSRFSPYNRFGSTDNAKDLDLRVHSTTMNVDSRQPIIIDGRKVYDMNGNVWEWCADFYQTTFYVDCVNSAEYRLKGYVENPICEDKEYAAHSFRGGSWRFDAKNCRCTSVNYWIATDTDDDLGFRLALDYD